MVIFYPKSFKTGLVPMYLMEITPTKYRGAAGTLHMVLGISLKFLL
jgi:hypothetical protein